MMRRRWILPLGVVSATALLFAVAAPQSWGDGDDDDVEVPFADAEIFFELNNTDGDLGIHALIDGEPWKRLEIEGPNEREILDIRVKSRLRRQGLTELCFESAEPTFDELSPERFFRRFPEGEYEVEGEALEGFELESTAEVTHLMPAPPGNVMVAGQPASDDCDEVVPVVDGDDPLVISWDEVTHSHADLGRTNEPIEVVRYQVVIEREEPTELVLSVELPPSVTEFEVPADLIDEGDEIKFEILVREESGNQTAFESCFEVD